MIETSTSSYTSPAPDFNFVVQRGVNGSYQIWFKPGGVHNEHYATEQPYDEHGAIMYIVSVVFIYGFSIILMIGSAVNKEKTDSGINKYINDLEKIQRAERKFHKSKTKVMMKKIINLGRSVSAPHHLNTKGNQQQRYNPGKVVMLPMVDTPPGSHRSTPEEQSRLLGHSATTTSLDSLSSSHSNSPDADSVNTQHHWPNNILMQSADEQFNNRTSPIYFSTRDRDVESGTDRAEPRRSVEDRKPSSSVTLHTVFEEEDEVFP